MKVPAVLDPAVIDVSSLLKPGVFLLYHNDRVVYIGKAKVLLVALAHHALRNRSNVPAWFPVKLITFDRIEIVPCDPVRATTYAAGLIEFYNPVHNRTPRSPRTTTAPHIPSPTPPPTVRRLP